MLNSLVPGEQAPFNYSASKLLFPCKVFNAEYMWVDCSDERVLLRRYWVGTLPLLKVQLGLNAAWSYWWWARGWEWEKGALGAKKESEKKRKKRWKNDSQTLPPASMIQTLIWRQHHVGWWFNISEAQTNQALLCRLLSAVVSQLCLQVYMKSTTNADCGLCCCRTTKSSDATGDAVNKCHASHHQD